MRQLCNVAYVMQTQGLDEAEQKKFDRELVSDPEHKVSHGVGDLMALMGGV